MTENEAKTKWCHKTLAIVPPNNTRLCIASACMAWRWQNEAIARDGFCGLAEPRIAEAQTP